MDLHTMAKQRTKVRAAFYGLGLVSTLMANLSFGQDLGTTEGTTEGVVSPAPAWSIGLQIGSQENTGISAQLMGFGSGALNTGLGIGWGGLSVHADYLWFLSKGLSVVETSSTAGYTGTRSKIQPYVGVGVQVGDHIGLRVPIGAQYTMTKDPLNFFGGITIIAGSKKEDLKVDLGILLGARLLM